MKEILEIKIGKLLSLRGLKLAVAESCTGGLIGHRITNVPGSSEYFSGGVIAYAYEAKVNLLGVSWETLQTYGAVSRETVLEMATGARLSLEADIAISVSGIAGPGGGLPNKPVGTVWVGLAAPDGKWARIFCFTGNREQNKSASSEAALTMLLEYLQGKRELDADERKQV
ncbi:MAG: CinA family protein [Anaerolineales bacterium]|jgi:PncC family amidohydrolase